MRGETFEQARTRGLRQTETGDALAAARWERGQRLTVAEAEAVSRWSRWGSDGYPIRKLGRGWTVDSPLASFGILKTKAEAVGRWETLIAVWIRLGGLEAQERCLAASAPAGIL